MPKNRVSTIIANCVFVFLCVLVIGCKAVPTKTVSDSEIEKNLPGLAQKGFSKIQCQVRAQSLDETGTATEQDFTNRSYGRKFSETELQILKKYEWKLSIDEQEAKLTAKGPKPLDSKAMMDFVNDNQAELVDAANELPLFYVNLILDLKGKQQTAVSGGYSFALKKGPIFISSDFKTIEIEETNSQGQRTHIRAELKQMEGVTFPTKVTYLRESFGRTYFYEFQTQNTVPVPTEIIVNYGAYAVGRSRFHLKNCELKK